MIDQDWGSLNPFNNKDYRKGYKAGNKAGYNLAKKKYKKKIKEFKDSIEELRIYVKRLQMDYQSLKEMHNPNSTTDNECVDRAERYGESR